MDALADDLLKVLLAVAVGGIIGLEREFRDKDAGFRTLIFICAGATLFTLLSIKLSQGRDTAYIAAHVVSGVGFLGAGVILRHGGRVLGLTTAATIWLVAALGMGIGAGQSTLALGVTALALVILWGFPHFERWVDAAREERTYELVLDLNLEKYRALEQAFRESRLHIKRHRQAKEGRRMSCSWRAMGSRRDHEALVRRLLADTEIEELRC